MQKQKPQIVRQIRTSTQPICINILQNGNVDVVYQLKLLMNPPRTELIPVERDTKQKEKKRKKREGRDWENWEGLKPLYMEKSRGKVLIAHFHGSSISANAAGVILSCFC